MLLGEKMNASWNPQISFKWWNCETSMLKLLLDRKRHPPGVFVSLQPLTWYLQVYNYDFFSQDSWYIYHWTITPTTQVYQATWLRLWRHHLDQYPHSRCLTWSRLHLIEIPNPIENHWKSLKIIENHWKSLKIIENHWKSLKIIENPIHHHLVAEHPPEIPTSHGKSMEF